MSTFPYDDRFTVHRTLPEKGTPRPELLDALRDHGQGGGRLLGVRASARAPCTAATMTTTHS